MKNYLKFITKVLLKKQIGRAYFAVGGVLCVLEIDRRLEILDELLLGCVEDLDLHHRTGGGVLAQVLQAGPGRLDFLEFGVVHYRTELARNQLVDFGDPRVERGAQVLGDDDRAGEHLANELGDDVLRTDALDIGARHLALRNDAVEKRSFCRDRRTRLFCN